MLKFLGVVVIVVAVVAAVDYAKKTPQERAADVRKETEPYKKEFEKELVQEMIDQYNMVKRNGGSKADICMHAGSVEYAYLQAKDEAGYANWKKIKKADCRRAGMDF